MKAIILPTILCSFYVGYSQNVGIGIQTPAAPLHIKAPTFEILRLEGTNPYLSFYNGGAYKGYLWHDGTRLVLGSSTNEPVIVQANYTSSPAFFTPDGRLGLNQPNPTERLDVNGNINFSGLLKVNGSSGATGQVLTSNGAAEPIWTNAALSNNIRFAVDFFTSTMLAGDLPILSTKYNLNPSVVSIGTSTITINQSGLYHFDIVAQTNANFSSAPSFFPRWGMYLNFGAGVQYSLFLFRPMQPLQNPNTSWVGADQVSIELYILAPATISVGSSINATAPTSFYADVHMTAHLISQ